jgi:hypothetical protein
MLSIISCGDIDAGAACRVRVFAASGSSKVISESGGSGAEGGGAGMEAGCSMKPKALDGGGPGRSVINANPPPSSPKVLGDCADGVEIN